MIFEINISIQLFSTMSAIIFALWGQVYWLWTMYISHLASKCSAVLSCIFRLDYHDRCFLTMTIIKASHDLYWMVFCSPELRAQVSFSDRLFSAVCLSVNFPHFIFCSKTTGPISTKLSTKHPLVKGIQVV